MPRFEVVSEFQPAGDQPKAIAALAEGVNRGDRYQTLLGITGSGKSATIAWTIEQVQKPTLVLAPNKALAAQLANEFRQFFPKNRVEYFVSYYDYYQPEAYIPQTDTFIEKDATVNDEIDRLRHSATAGLLVRDDVVIVASVSAIYGLGSPEQYKGQLLRLVQGVEYPMQEAIKRLVDIQYERNEVNLIRGKFRVRGDTLEVFPSYEETIVRVQYWGDEVERHPPIQPGHRRGDGGAVRGISSSPPLTTSPSGSGCSAPSRPSRWSWRTGSPTLEGRGKMLEAQRLRMRTNYDLEMMREVGFCSGIENYSRHLDGHEPGRGPVHTARLLPQGLPDDHRRVPRDGSPDRRPVRGRPLPQGGACRPRVPTPVGEGQPAAPLRRVAGQRPIRWSSCRQHPPEFEISHSTQVVEQIIRPTGLVDPEVMIRPTKGQIDDLLDEIRERAVRDQRVLVTTLTKKMAEDLTDYLLEMGVRARYMHSEIDTLERVQIMRELQTR